VTAFERHRISIDGEDWLTTTDPLRDFLAGRGYQPVMISTANFWGYHADWQVRDGHLYLTRLEGQQLVSRHGSTTGSERVTLDPVELFGTALPVEATWYRGTIWAERGLVTYVHAAWESAYAESRDVVVEDGRVVSMSPIRQRTPPPPPPEPPAPRPWWRRLLGR
jgi:hypothetical protein